MSKCYERRFREVAGTCWDLLGGEEAKATFGGGFEGEHAGEWVLEVVVFLLVRAAAFAFLWSSR